MVSPFQSPAVLSICPGTLGLEKGLQRAAGPIRVVAYVEIEAYAIANLIAGMETGMVEPCPVWTDATTFDARPFRGRIHGVVAGYPCPGESLAGLREGHLYKGFIWPSIRRAIAATRPFFCFFENVDDHLTGTFPIVQRSLRNMGYAVEAGIFTAQEAGYPHERERLFILAIASDLAKWGIGRKVSGKASKDEGAAQRKYWEWMRTQFADCGKNLAYPNCSGLTKFRNDGLKIKSDDNRTGDPGTVIPDTNSEHGKRSGAFYEAGRIPNIAYDYRPVAPPGPFQYEWEEPRVIESLVGCSINGYNFREDLLRAEGNAVVEQSAEIAFYNLIDKHIKNHLR